MSGGFDEERGAAATRHNPIDVHVGHQIRQRRATLGISQEQLAGVLGLSFQQVQKYERGVNRVGASRLHDLATALDVPIGYFFEDMPGTKPTPATGMRESQQTLDEDILGRRETLDLVRAFSGITDADVRHHVLELIRSLGPDPAS
jgi:transcriptional regulator with XRE-family HTH domain